MTVAPTVNRHLKLPPYDISNTPPWWSLRRLWRRGGVEQPGTAFLFQAIAIALDVDRCRMVDETIKDRARDEGVPEDLGPRAETFKCRKGGN